MRETLGIGTDHHIDVPFGVEDQLAVVFDIGSDARSDDTVTSISQLRSSSWRSRRPRAGRPESLTTGVRTLPGVVGRAQRLLAPAV